MPQVLPGNIPEVRIHEERKPISDLLYERIGSVYQILLMASFVPFLVYFMLSWRDHIHRSFLQFFHGEDRLVAARSLQGIADMVRAFVVGNFLLGLLLAALSRSAFWLMHLPYPAAGGAVQRLPEPGAVRRAAAGDDPAAVRGAAAAIGLDLHPGFVIGGDAAPDRAEPALSQDRRVARAFESAGGDVLADVLGIPLGRPRPAACDPADRRQSKPSATTLRACDPWKTQATEKASAAKITSHHTPRRRICVPL